MSLITRCPHCATSFKVVADQLRISDGWVRCGHCKEVFDATEQLLVQAPEPLLPDMPLHDLKAPPAPVARPAPEGGVWGVGGVKEGPAPRAESVIGSPPARTLPQEPQPRAAGAVPPSSPVAAHPTAAAEAQAPAQPWPAVPAFLRMPPDAEPATVDLQGTSVLPQPAEVEAVPQARHSVSPAPVPREPDAALRLVPQEGHASARTSVDDVPLPTLHGDSHWPPAPEDKGSAQVVPPATVKPRVEVAHEPSEEDPDDAQEAAALAAELGFVKAARRSAFWRHPAVRFALALMALCLLVLLALQVALREHDAIAARHPGARALLEQLCQRMHCTVRPPQDIAAVVIDSSSFLKTRDDASAYQLQFSVKNQANFVVAVPALELSLTDTQDQVVLRRVFRPEELHAPAELAPGATWSAGVVVRLIEMNGMVAGYRLLAFYP